VWNTRGRERLLKLTFSPPIAEEKDCSLHLLKVLEKMELIPQEE
jgi:hypothetical protein